MLLSSTICLLGNHVATKKRVRLNMLSIVSITPPIAASAVPLCLTATIKFFSKFGALKERSYDEIIWLQTLTIYREEKNIVRELLRYRRTALFQCLVINISQGVPIH
jgi:hypothetical protein